MLARVRLAVQSHLDYESRLHDIARRIYYILLSTADKQPYTPANEINTHVIEWLDNRDTDDSFFAWVHYMDTHYPFYQDGEMLEKIGADQISSTEQRRVNRLMNESPEKLDEGDINTLTTLYDAETRFTDLEIGRLLDALRERKLYDDTVIIITSDHGEAFGEHGGFGHYKALYEELFRVPLVIHVPTQTSATVDTQVGLVDLKPTILDYGGLEIPESTSGESLLPVIEDSQYNRTDVRHVIGHGDPLGVRTDRWKYIWWDRNGDEPLDAELFDLRADPDEMEDVSNDHPDVVSEFDAFLADHVARARETDHDPDAVADAPAKDEDMEAQLEALGYK
jgi:arylsulfatase A-like enzyme